MIGELKGNGWEAELADDGTWKASHELIQLVLDTRYVVKEDSSPALGVFGRATLLRAADGLKAEAELGPEPEYPEDAKDRIY